MEAAMHVSPGTSLEAAHEIAHAVEAAIKERFPGIAEVVVHAEPVHHGRRLDETHPA